MRLVASMLGYSFILSVYLWLSLLISSLTYGTLRSWCRVSLVTYQSALTMILRYLFWNLCSISMFVGVGGCVPQLRAISSNELKEPEILSVHAFSQSAFLFNTRPLSLLPARPTNFRTMRRAITKPWIRMTSCAISRKKGEKTEAGFNGSQNNDVSSVPTSWKLVRSDCQLVVSRSGKDSKGGYICTNANSRHRCVKST